MVSEKGHAKRWNRYLLGLLPRGTRLGAVAQRDQCRDFRTISFCPFGRGDSDDGQRQRGSKARLRRAHGQCRAAWRHCETMR